MEENMVEKNCCGKDGACGDCKMGSCCGHKCGGKHACRVISFIIIIAIVFCVGTMVGRDNDFRGLNKRENFMDRIKYSFKKDIPEYSNNNSTGSVTVDVLPNTTTP